MELGKERKFSREVADENLKYDNLTSLDSGSNQTL
jgi:hypothetical protein